MIKFYEDGHLYTSVDPDQIKWLSITGVIKRLHEEFDAEAKAASCAVRKPTAKYPNKWFGMDPEEIKAAWNGERDRAAELGHWYHSKREAELIESGGSLIIKPTIIDGVKYAPEQVLKEGIYPELLIYLLSAQICGQSDVVEVKDGKVNIRDYKTSKEISQKGFTNWKGTKMMFYPLDHLEDCEFNHYAIQLSLYMYMVLRHNPNLKPGNLCIEHIKFEVEKSDKYGYPIYKKDGKGNFIVKEIEFLRMPYLKKECMDILEWLKIHKQYF